METRKYAAIVVIGSILCFDVVVYYHQEASGPDTRIPICYPSGKIVYDSLGVEKSRVFEK